LEFKWRNWIEGRAALLYALGEVDCLRRDETVWGGKGLGKRGRQSFLPARKSELGHKGSLKLINGRLFANPHLDPAAARGGVKSDELTVLVIAWAK
jgi:hypothetical protein